MNILDYLEMRGDLTFAERPFNEVDNLIFSVLAYLDMHDIVPEEFVFDVSLRKLCKRYLELGYDQSYIVNNPKILLRKIVSCKRFERVRVGGYSHHVSQDEQVQFSCATFMLGDGTAYVGFSGTDDYLTAWREDFNFTFMNSTPGQDEAVDYLNRLGSCTVCPLRLGGHSKGGNFAEYGAAFCDQGHLTAWLLSVARAARPLRRGNPAFPCQRIHGRDDQALAEFPGGRAEEVGHLRRIRLSGSLRRYHADRAECQQMGVVQRNSQGGSQNRSRCAGRNLHLP